MSEVQNPDPQKGKIGKHPMLKFLICKQNTFLDISIQSCNVTSTDKNDFDREKAIKIAILSDIPMSKETQQELQM